MYADVPPEVEDEESEPVMKKKRVRGKRPSSASNPSSAKKRPASQEVATAASGTVASPAAGSSGALGDLGWAKKPEELGPASVAASFQWGETYLRRFSDLFGLRYLISKLQAPWLRVLMLATLFTGTGMAEAAVGGAIHAAQLVLRAYGFEGPVPTLIFDIACERNTICQRFLQSRWPARCVYSDILGFKSHGRFPNMKLRPVNKCSTHNGHCDIRHASRHEHGTVKILIFGAPCVMFSMRGDQKGQQDPRYVCHEVYHCCLGGSWAGRGVGRGRVAGGRVGRGRVAGNS
jgi:hypothetical protein